MPDMADIVVKKYDGTTNITYGKVNRGGSDSIWALWRDTTAAAIVKAKATLEMMSKWNAKQTVRRLELKFLYPYFVTDTTTGVTSVQEYISLTATWQVPQNVPAGYMNEAAAQGGNLCASTLIRDSVIAGSTPT